MIICHMCVGIDLFISLQLYDIFRGYGLYDGSKNDKEENSF